MATDTASKLDELLDGLAGYAGDSKDKKREVALKLLDNEATKEIAEVIYRKGLSKRKADDSGTVTELETQLTTTKDELAEANKKIRELESKQPNWERMREEADRKWQAKLEAAEAKVTEERHASLSDKVDKLGRAAASLVKAGQHSMELRTTTYYRRAEAEHRRILAQALCKPKKKSFAQMLTKIPPVGKDSDFERVED